LCISLYIPLFLFYSRCASFAVFLINLLLLLPLSVSIFQLSVYLAVYFFVSFSVGVSVSVYLCVSLCVFHRSGRIYLFLSLYFLCHDVFLCFSLSLSVCLSLSLYLSFFLIFSPVLAAFFFSLDFFFIFYPKSKKKNLQTVTPRFISFFKKLLKFLTALYSPSTYPLSFSKPWHYVINLICRCCTLLTNKLECLTSKNLFTLAYSFLGGGLP
jgi:hypothetical protein